MANLKEKILQSLRSTKQVETTLNTIAKSQENLLKNYSNPVFNKRDKNKILKSYSNLQDVGKSLYRYNTLQEHNYLNDAKEEKGNIESKVLKGGVSYNKYVWHCENGEHTCDVCADLDGQEFDYYDEVPERPHPNCKCYVEIVEYDDENSIPETNESEEPCDVLEQIDELIIKMENTKGEIDTLVEDLKFDIQDYENDLERVEKLIQDNNTALEILGEDYGKHLPDCENNIDIEYEQANNQNITLKEILKDIKRLLEMGKEGIGTLIIFGANFIALLIRAYILKQYEMDKYYHSKANCEAVQAFGELGEEAATLLSDTKEKIDQYRNFYAKSHKVTIEEAIADSERDQVANRLGRERGRIYPNCKCYELISDLKPKHKK